MADKKAVVLLSGGLDSTVTLYWAKAKGFCCNCLIFDYGQRHVKEVQIAKGLAEEAGCVYTVIKFALPWGGSSLLTDGPIPEDRDIKIDEIPSTYVPARNTIFLSFALSFAEAIRAKGIFIGANWIDYSGYPDCRPQYYRVYEKLIEKGTKMGVQNEGIKIYTPLIKKKKSEIIKLGMKLNAPIFKTWSCYEGDELPCGRCDSCHLRLRGFEEAGINK